MNKVKIGIVAFLVSLITFGLFYVVGINKPNYYIDGEEYFREVLIDTGSSTDDIANTLYKENLVNSRALFNLYVYLNRRTLQAGRYYLPVDADIKSLVDILGKGSFDYRLTFIEGWRVEEMASYLDREFGDAGFGKAFLDSKYTREGYMFPDTYFFFKEASPYDVAKELSDNFNEKIKDLEINNSDFTLDEIVILASIVEREVRHPDDKAVVAGILIKRLDNNWALQADATVQYAIGGCSTCDNTWWKPVSSSDLHIDSPYNTYRNKGFPPAPICNPGLDSIKAVLEYKETPYWFYLNDKDGNTHYATTVEEHNENIRKYLNSK